MTKLHRTYLLTVMLLTLTLLGLSVTPGLVLDPYHVFHPDQRLITRNFGSNERFEKIRFLQQRCQDFDGFILGSSRVNAYRVDTAASLFGGRFYNMTVSADSIGGLQPRIRWLLRHCQPRLLVIALDYDMFTAADPDDSDLLRREHPAVSGRHWGSFWSDYLFVSPRTLLKAWRSQRQSQDDYLFDITTGHYRFAHADHLRLTGQPFHIRPIIPVCYAPSRALGADYPHQLQQLQILVNEVRQAGITAHFVVNPLNHTYQAGFVAADYSRWARDMARITDGLWFFAGFTPQTKDDSLYYESSHFTPELGDAILHRMAKPPAAPVYFDAQGEAMLGQLVSAHMYQRQLSCEKAAP